MSERSPDLQAPASSGTRPSDSPEPPVRVLITAGPTHEPIDAVRYIGNRSSGRMGVAIADAAAAAGCATTLLLGPVAEPPADADSPRRVVRFRTTADLEAALSAHWPAHDVLIMAAAVADYRPLAPATDGKLRRSDAGLSIELEATPDLLAGVRASSRDDQTLIGFALEPEDRLEASARAKLERKGVHGIVANPLRTMDAGEIDGVLHRPDGVVAPPARPLPKPAFAAWLVAEVLALHRARTAQPVPGR